MPNGRHRALSHTGNIMTKYSLRARMMILILAPTLMIGLLLSTFLLLTVTMNYRVS